MPTDAKDHRKKIKEKYKKGYVKFTPNSFLTEVEARAEASSPGFLREFTAEVLKKHGTKIVKGDYTIDTFKFKAWRDMPVGPNLPLPPKYQGFAAWKP